MAVTPREPLYTPSLVFQRQPDFIPPNLLTLPASSVAAAPFVQRDFTPRMAFTFRQPEQFPNLVLSVVTAPNALLFPRDYMQARAFAYRQPEQYPNLALNIVVAAALPPFIPYDWPTQALRKFNPMDFTPQNWAIFSPPPIPPAPVTDFPAGGWEPHRKRRTRKEIQDERAALGILTRESAQEDVQQVAAAVIESREKPGLELADAEQATLLRGMLAERDMIIKNEQFLNMLLVKAIGAEIEKMHEERAIVQFLFDL